MAEQQPPALLPRLIMGQLERGALNRQYTGTLSDTDAKALISRSYNTTKDEASAVDRVVQSPLTLYASSGDFVRHAIWELLNAWDQAGFPDEYVPDITAHVKAMRDAAQRVRLRQQFSDILTTYESSLTEGLDTGDFDLIEATLDTLEGYVVRTPDPHWQNYLRKVILRSGVVKATIEALVTAVEGKAPGWQQYARPAEHWALWLEHLAE